MLKNVNVGVLGHVDAGKTALCRILVQHAEAGVKSTAADDKSRQSRERGITLDLGFSSFRVNREDDDFQVTLVDCPGHARLLRTVLCGARIIDVAALVVDAAEGIQPQTVECMVLASLLKKPLLIVLSKCDKVDKKRASVVSRKVKRQLRELGLQTKPMVVATSTVSDEWARDSALRVVEAVAQLAHAHTRANPTDQCDRDGADDTVVAVDHVFAVSGRQGVVATGTVLSGRVLVGDTMHVPSAYRVTHEDTHEIDAVTTNDAFTVQSLQSFRNAVESADAGDRVAMQLTLSRQSDKESLSRLLSHDRVLLGVSESAVTYVQHVVASVVPVVTCTRPIASGTSWHVNIGSDTVMATCHFFREPASSTYRGGVFDHACDYVHLDELPSHTDDNETSALCYLIFDRPVAVSRQNPGMLVAAALQQQQHRECRLVFRGTVRALRAKPRRMRQKLRFGSVERCKDCELIVIGLFDKGAKTDRFNGLRVALFQEEPSRYAETPALVFDSADAVGVITGAFGKKGKIRIRIETVHNESVEDWTRAHVALPLKKYVGGDRKALLQ
ncbi:MAG: hypothetical protein MHM6MM_002003 [Cercozoa sp. M6MM]